MSRQNPNFPIGTEVSVPASILSGETAVTEARQDGDWIEGVVIGCRDGVGDTKLVRICLLLKGSAHTTGEIPAQQLKSASRRAS